MKNYVETRSGYLSFLNWDIKRTIDFWLDDCQPHKRGLVNRSKLIVEVFKMTKIIIIFSTLLSISTLADHHKDSHKDSDKDSHQDRPRSDLFSEADSDGDGRVSTAEHEVMIEEMAARGRDRFNGMDLNGDGYITKDEAKAKRKEMREKKKANRQKSKWLMKKSDSQP
jgi:hypothetical protein